MVRGSARPDTHLTFVLPGSGGEDGALAFGTETVELSVRAGPGLERCEVARTDDDAAAATVTVDSRDLTGVAFVLEQGRVAWKPLAPT